MLRKIFNNFLLNFVADFKEQEKNSLKLEMRKKRRLFSAWKELAKADKEEEESEDDEFENEVQELIIEFRKVKNFGKNFE